MPALRTLRVLGVTCGVMWSLGAPARVSAAAAEAPPERAEVVLSGEATDRLLAKMLPATVEVPADKASGTPATTVRLVEARACGGSANGARARFLGVVRPDGAPAAPPLLGGARDCHDKLAEIARRGAAAADAGSVA